MEIPGDLPYTRRVPGRGSFGKVPSVLSVGPQMNLGKLQRPLSIPPFTPGGVLQSPRHFRGTEGTPDTKEVEVSLRGAT